MDGISPCMSCRGIPCQCGNTLMTVKGMPKYEQLPPGIYETLYGEVVERYTELKRETDAVREELAEWRSGKRRVYWRVKKPGCVGEFATKQEAWNWWAEGFAWGQGKSDVVLGVYRVTVGPAKKKEVG